jgi:hypothetical protein
MALWGNDDNIQTFGTVSLSGNTVTGTGTTFSTDITVGQLIRFGVRGGVGTYYGDAVVIGITSDRVLTIGSTAGLNPALIGAGATQYGVSELPKSSVLDHQYSQKHDTQPSYRTIAEATVNGTVAIGTANIAIDQSVAGLNLTVGGHARQGVLNDGSVIQFAGLGTALASADQAAGIGTDLIPVVAPAGVVASDSVDVEVGGIDVSATILSIGATTISIASTISSAISAGDQLTFTSDKVISLASGVTAEIADGALIEFQALAGGYDRIVYGISTDTSGNSVAYQGADQGWVGVTTYIDMHGNLRVKKETLVAMSGIQTGAFGINYPTDV